MASHTIAAFKSKHWLQEPPHLYRSPIKNISEKVYIWSEWGQCNESTCFQRRKRKCIDELSCSGIDEGLDATHDDFIGAGWEKLERACMDKPDCFAAINDVTTGTNPMAGEFQKSLSIPKNRK